MELSPQRMETSPCLMGSSSTEPADQLKGEGEALTTPSSPALWCQGTCSSQPRGSIHLLFLFLPLCHCGFWGCSPEKKPGWWETFMVGFSGFPGEQWDKNEIVTALLLPFPHHIRETTSSWETPMPHDMVPQPLLAFSGGFSCHLQMAAGTSFAGTCCRGSPRLCFFLLIGFCGCSSPRYSHALEEEASLPCRLTARLTQLGVSQHEV